MDDLKKYKGFEAVVNFSAEDGIFYRKLQNIPDLVTFEGDTTNAATLAFEAAVDDYMKTVALIKKTIPQVALANNI